MGDIDSSATSGVEVRGYRRGTLSTDGWDQYVVPVKDRIVSYQGRMSTYRMVGRAAATQNLLGIFNASASVLVCVNRIMLDSYSLAARLIGVPPPIARCSRITAVPTNGTAGVKTPLDTGGSPDASVTTWQDASADGTNSATALAATLTTGSSLAQEVLARQVLTTGTGAATGFPPLYQFEPADRIEFFVGAPDIILRQNQGVILHLASPAASSIPNTDHFVATIDWEEFTRP